MIAQKYTQLLKSRQYGFMFTKYWWLNYTRKKFTTEEVIYYKIVRSTYRQTNINVGDPTTFDLHPTI